MLVQSMAPSAAEIALAPTATCTIVGADGRVRSSSGGAGSGGAVAGSRLITEPAPYAGAPYGGASDLGSESDVPVDSLSEDTGDEFRDDIERGAQALYGSLPPTRMPQRWWVEAAAALRANAARRACRRMPPE